MNKTQTLTAPVLVMAAMLGLGACGTSGDEARTTFDSYSASSTYTLNGSAADFDTDSDIVCNDAVSLIMPVTLGAHDAQALRDSIMMRALDAKPTSIAKAMNQWLTATAAEHPYPTSPSDVPAQNADGFVHVKGYIANLTPTTLVYCITTDSYAPGAANGFSTTDYINYSIAENRFIGLADIFTPQGLAALPQVIAEQAATNPQYAGNVDITSLPEAGNFYLSSEGEIVFSYYPTEVAPHYLGTIQVAFYPYELINYLSPQAITTFGLTDLEQ